MISGTLIPTGVSAMITFVGQGVPQLANPSFTVGYVLAPLQISIRNAANSAELLDGAHYDKCCSVNPELLTNPSGATLTEATSFVVRVGETFGAATMLRSIGETWPTADAPVFAATPQNGIAWVYSTESGFYNPAFPASPDGLDRAGLATQGTRFYLRFYNVPPGVVLYSGLYALGSTAADSPVRKIVNEIGPFVAAPAVVTAAGPYAPLTMVEPNVYEGIYEVTGFGAIPGMISNYDIPVLVGYNSSSVTPGPVQLQAGLAPRIDSDDPSNQTAPRFAVPTLPLTRHAFEISGASVASISITATAGLNTTTAPFTVQGAADCQPGVYQTPRTFDWAVGLSCTVNFPDESLPQYPGARYRRNGWLGGPSGSSQTIVVPAGNHTYTMAYISELLVKAAVSPAGCGTNTLQGGSTQQWVLPGSQVSATATITAGSSCSFQGFSSSYGPGLSFQNPYKVAPYDPVTIVANFSQGVPRMILSTYSKSGTAGTRVFNIALRNSGTASAAQPNITNATIVQSSGVPCAPAVRLVSSLPLLGPATLAPAASATYPVQVDFSGCTSLPIATPFRLTLTVAAANAAPQTIAITTAR
ncbi:hypothetical protein [uncultured Paludibaculum sp.]|uniref:hypothetical protein n=1 Tax=uncultured Paludibaculum sp. TaxID=1765020 RepID=UPI002AAB59B3|nr:hypothetical protein [uncultured Paludibaculum sp.]